MPKLKRRPPIKTNELDLSKLKELNAFSYSWNSDRKWIIYEIDSAETNKTVIKRLIRVNYSRDDSSSPWKEDSRYRYYTRRMKILCIGGDYDQKLLTTDTAPKLGYTMFINYGPGRTAEFPKKVFLHTESLARRLGLKW